MNTDRSKPSIPNDEVVIWRYMEDWQFKDFLRCFSDFEAWDLGASADGWRLPNGQLWFTYSWGFEDEFEGKIPASSRDRKEYIERAILERGWSEEKSNLIRRLYLDVDNEKLLDGMEFASSLHGSSPWHANDQINPSMWHFAGDKNGVAIRSTVGRIRNALRTAVGMPQGASPDVCAVGYVDHGTYFTLYDGAQGIISIVDRDHKHENEIRFFARSPALNALSMKYQIRADLPIGKRLAFDSKEDCIAYFKRIWGPFTNEDYEHRKVLAEKVVQLGELTTDVLRLACLDVEDKGVPGFNLPLNLIDTLHEVVTSPKSDPGYASRVERMLKRIRCEQPSVRRG